jgi:hypothetical protein
MKWRSQARHINIALSGLHELNFNLVLGFRFAPPQAIGYFAASRLSRYFAFASFRAAATAREGIVRAFLVRASFSL